MITDWAELLAEYQAFDDLGEESHGAVLRDFARDRYDYAVGVAFLTRIPGVAMVLVGMIMGDALPIHPAVLIALGPFLVRLLPRWCRRYGEPQLAGLLLDRWLDRRVRDFDG